MSIDPTHPWAARAAELLDEVGLPADYPEAYIDEDDLMVDARGEAALRLARAAGWEGEDVEEGAGPAELWSFRRRLDA
jgi:hypothetical protein